MLVSFPTYMAFGKLDEKGFFEENGYSMASYAIGGQVIHHFGTNGKGFVFKDVWHGKTLRYSLGPDLNKLFQFHFSTEYPFSMENPVFEHWMKTVEEKGNFQIWIPHKPTKPESIIYVPAVKLYLINIPVAMDQWPFLEKVMVDPLLSNHFFHLSPLVISGTKQVHLRKYRQVPEQIEIPVANLQLLAPAAFVPAICESLSLKGIMSSNRMLQGIVCDIVDYFINAAFLFLGEPNEDFSVYVYPAPELSAESIKRSKDPEKWVNAYNQWQDISLKQGPGSKIKVPILNCLLKKLSSLGFNLTEQNPSANDIYYKLNFDGDQLKYDKNSVEADYGKRRKHFQEDQRRITSFMNHMESGKSFNEMRDEEITFWLHRY